MGRPQTQRARANRAWRLAALVLGVVVLNIGCAPFTILAFLWPGDSRKAPAYPLVCKDKKETKVVVLAAFTTPDTRPEANGADQDIAERLIAVLKKNYEEDGKKVKIVPHYQVRDYQNKSPLGQAPFTPYDVGKHFGADRVVNLEVTRLELYKEGSLRTLFEGRADISVTVTDMSRPREEGPAFHDEYVSQYPQSGPRSVDGSNPAMFRGLFVQHIAEGLARFFTPYEITPGDQMRYDN